MKILRLNVAGQPIEWLNWEQAVCLHARDLVVWSLGATVRAVHGGTQRLTGMRSVVDLPSIIACGGERIARPRTNYPLNNPALFARDGFLCLYCGRDFPHQQLTRDHIQPTSRGGTDRWENVVAACRRCNQHKADQTPEEANMQLVALPYQPPNTGRSDGLFAHPVLQKQPLSLAAEPLANKALGKGCQNQHRT